MAVWIAVMILGAIGGLANATASDGGLLVPKIETVAGARILKLGFLINVFLGLIAALLAFGLYGPFSQTVAFGSSSSVSGPNASASAVTWAQLLASFFVGWSGSGWITNEAKKRTLKNSVGGQPAAGLEGGAAMPQDVQKVINAL
jgi:hypothetical protein